MPAGLSVVGKKELLLLTLLLGHFGLYSGGNVGSMKLKVIYCIFKDYLKYLSSRIESTQSGRNQRRTHELNWEPNSKPVILFKNTFPHLLSWFSDCNYNTFLFNIFKILFTLYIKKVLSTVFCVGLVAYVTGVLLWYYLLPSIGLIFLHTNVFSNYHKVRRTNSYNSKIPLFSVHLSFLTLKHLM